MILLKSLIVFLLLLLAAHLFKKGWGKKRDGRQEGFANADVDEINNQFDMNVAANLENATATANNDNNANVGGGEMAPPIGKGKPSASQKVQSEALVQQQAKEDQTNGMHKEAANKALDMNYLKEQMAELIKLSNEAKEIK